MLVILLKSYGILLFIMAVLDGVSTVRTVDVGKTRTGCWGSTVLGNCISEEEGNERALLYDNIFTIR